MGNRIDIGVIPRGVYEGYIWMSDSKSPDEFHARDLDLDFLNKLTNPFVIEGQLYCSVQQKSYSIKYVDGKHLVVAYDLNALDDNFTKKEFVPNRMQADKLLFRQYWALERDELCEGMSVQIPSAFVFVGFKNKNENKKEEVEK